MGVIAKLKQGYHFLDHPVFTAKQLLYSFIFIVQWFQANGSRGC